MNTTEQVVALLLALQAVSAAYLLIVGSVGTLGAGRFAIFLAVDLLSFAVIAHIFTRERWGEVVGRAWILVSSVGLIILLISSLYFP
jgi:hypothetical protein